jgi:penicillin-binding protein-related factor A (putative recombinase)
VSMTGREFEALITFRAQRLEDQKILMLGRYGVTARMINNPETGKGEWVVIPSLPDFEGCVFGTGRQIIIEAKVCSQSSYAIAANDQKHPKQIEHMLNRAEFGALCFLMIHYNARELKTKSEPAETFAVPVLDNHFWREYQNGERRTLNRSEAEMHGIRIPWDTHSQRATKLTPNLSYLLPIQ